MCFRSSTQVFRLYYTISSGKPKYFDISKVYKEFFIITQLHLRNFYSSSFAVVFNILQTPFLTCNLKFQIVFFDLNGSILRYRKLQIASQAFLPFVLKVSNLPPADFEPEATTLLYRQWQFLCLHLLEFVVDCFLYLAFLRHAQSVLYSR